VAFLAAGGPVTAAETKSDPKSKAAIKPWLELISGTDAHWLRNAFKAADLRRWKTVTSYGQKIKDPLARKLVTWRRLTVQGTGSNFAEIDQFLAENPEWPRRRRLLRRAEELIPPGMPAEDAMVWFGGREPESATGLTRLGEAHLALGEGDMGREIIRKAWIEGNFPRAQARRFYNKHRKILSMTDNIKRLDRLLWQGRYGPARRMTYLAPADWQRLAQARYSLRRRTGNVDYLISKVPPHLTNHPGLVFERLRWRRRKNKDNAVDLAQSLPAALPHAEIWWDERSTLARRAITKGRITDAYRIASRNGLKPGTAAFAEAEWLSGWISLRFLKEPAKAFEHFNRMYEAVKFPVSISRGAYWAGRAAEAQGKDELAVGWYRKAAAHPLSYYGQLAFARLRPGTSLKLPGVVNLPTDPNTEFDTHELVRAILILGDIAAHDQVGYFVRQLMEISEKPQWWARVARLARLTGRPDLSIRIAKKAARNGTPLPREAFPVLKPPALPAHADGIPPEVPLVLAVIRQESAFRVSAKSHAGARGLMQLMPATAKSVAKRLKQRFSRVRLSSSPKYNMTLGQAYLASVLKEFKGSYVLALASYNAGPHRARKWIKRNGDPRDKDVDSIDWVELIPFDETRNYVQRVLENLQIYRLGLSKTEIALGLEDDLHVSGN